VDYKKFMEYVTSSLWTRAGGNWSRKSEVTEINLKWVESLKNFHPSGIRTIVKPGVVRVRPIKQAVGTRRNSLRQ